MKMSKKYIRRRRTLLGAALMAAALSVAACASTNKGDEYSSLYVDTARVQSINYKANTVGVVDSEGEVWSFTGCDDWMLNEDILMIMSDKGTENLNDDKIIKVQHK